MVYLLWMATPTWASGLTLYGLGSRGPAMGGCLTALADDFSATCYNPAGVVEGRRTRISLGLQFTMPRLRVNNNLQTLEDVVGIVGGASIPIPFGGPLKDRLALGLAVFLPTKSWRMVRIHFPPPSEPIFPLYEDRTEHFAGIACLGVKLIEGVSIGGGVLFYPFDSPNRIESAETGALGTFEVDAELQLMVRYAAHGGIRISPGEFHESLEKLEIGLSYRGSIKQYFALPANIELGFMPVSITLDGINHYSPAEINVGIAWRTTERLTLAVEGAWSNWSSFPPVHLRCGVAGINEFFPNFEDLFYDPPHPNFEDVYTPRLGMEYVLRRSGWGGITLRGGYFYSRSPAPSTQDKTGLLDCDKHIFSCGFGLELRRFLSHKFEKPLIMDGHIQLHYLARRHIHQTGAQGGAETNRISADGLVLSGGLIVTLSF